MSNHEGQKPVRKEMSRRQFLSYTLGGTTAFMAGGVVLPMVRFAVDPLLQKKEKSAFVKIVEESAITNDPVEYKFKVHQVDGWYESEAELVAWVSRGPDGKIFALSPVCKHLGCTITWNNEQNDQYVCPCHGAHYTRDGKNLSVAPSPLDEYEVQLKDGFVYLGPIVPNTRV
ncbi:ubiquinol-cytochrome c reductase iron-sulfur subunit [Paenibacillus xylaniclasticus]|uniref:ubiquinol-cytochrome c reductase iron-sulfur subunit n=1 Tax=Paenibacillus xylaniclasticus TaxID=588083 RepID=UPI000FD8F1AB|nr:MULTISPECIES: ubiquinol-cytochrome c reductase iron-sulfur subunit [Paenibacillus]GFN30669.1 menaquinol-cytochrome C reductase iron-sulfur subunit [Paenibacillus curdlanolyticus]